MKINPQLFLPFSKKFCIQVSSAGPFSDADEELQNDPTDANILQDQYIKVFSDPFNGNADELNKPNKIDKS